MTRGIIVQNWVWHLQIFFCFKSPSINLRFPSAFLDVTNRPQYCRRPEMILTFPKNTSWILWSMKSNVQVFNWNYWSCHSGPARLGEIGNGYGDLYCGSRSLMDIEFDWSIARGTYHIPWGSGWGFFCCMVQIMRKNSKTWPPSRFKIPTQVVLHNPGPFPQVCWNFFL